MSSASLIAFSTSLGLLILIVSFKTVALSWGVVNTTRLPGYLYIQNLALASEGGVEGGTVGKKMLEVMIFLFPFYFKAALFFVWRHERCQCLRNTEVCCLGRTLVQN